jgi:putative DNA primase/helicase
MDAGVSCPVCDKPDGCLVAADDPNDPKACICIRVESGKKTGFGDLHILKPEGKLIHESILPESEHPIIIVEGLSDTCAALDLGFVAVGRPSALGGMAELARLVRGRSVIVVGENDAGVGKQGLSSTIVSLTRGCTSVLGVMPPKNRKDLRDWATADGLTADQLIAYAHSHGSTEASIDVLPDAAPLHLAERWLLDEHTESDALLLRRYKGQWFRFTESRYDEVEPDATIRGGLYAYLDGREYKKAASDGSVSVEVYEPARSRISDIVDALNKSCPVEGDPPVWLDDRTEPDPRHLIVFRNGYVNTGIHGDQTDFTLANTSPHLFTLTSLPYDYDPEAACPRWLAWLEETLGDDPKKIELLQEWFGLSMTPDMSYEKFMLFRGRSGAGKGTALEVLRKVVGDKQVATTTFGGLCTDFGRAPLVGKLAAFMPDAQLPHRSESKRALETLLSIIGQDGVNINRKNLPELPDHKLMCRFTIAVNELPALPDHAQALIRRLLVIDFGECFEGREDRSLKTPSGLPSEVSGIANWALSGLRRLRETDTFTVPKSAATTIAEFRKITSPVVEFVEDVCVRTADAEVERVALYDAWTGWCRERGLQPGPRSRLGQRIIASFPNIFVEQPVAFSKTRRKAMYKGIALQDWALQSYLGRPS